MIELIKGLPSHVARFRATREVTQQDYKEVVFPAAAELVKAYGRT